MLTQPSTKRTQKYNRGIRIEDDLKLKLTINFTCVFTSLSRILFLFCFKRNESPRENGLADQLLKEKLKP